MQKDFVALYCICISLYSPSKANLWTRHIILPVEWYVGIKNTFESGIFYVYHLFVEVLFKIFFS